ncbi:MAG: VCBS repeat-containing protein [candidate division KSB1 bacterium]|nr:VCBS repeat-containing protein [candidate division KSB1 bacterium]MDZ7275898.1 VCBS repeat-containing protein [candidate division KSB1 bacterium]MDZ7287648.1 VCBS repeat-containing protein [candidate division KSB1 bacterium]MDZ7306810.1 VCBS repeat-containing protein [candidate division KSB1 bacterium]MDZ7350626.1 VCBS repeat-containing protein [candidate division KSB1 bacterium]
MELENQPSAFAAMRRHFNRAGSRFAAIVAFLLIGCEQHNFPPGHFFRATSAETVSSPAAGDFNRDGRLEIVIASFDGFCYVLDDSLRDLPNWPQRLAGGAFSSPALWDVDGDHQPEIFIGGNDGRLHGWQRDGRCVAGFPIDLGYRLWSSPVIIADSLLAIGGREQMFLFDRHGRPASGWPQSMQGWAMATPAWHDDLLVITTLTLGEASRGYIHAWHLSGAPYPGFPVRLPMDAPAPPSLADLNGDGRVEIIAGDESGLLHVLQLDGSALPPFPRLVGRGIHANPVVSDLDQNGKPDLVFSTTDGAVHAWSATGDCLLGWPVRLGYEMNSSAAVVALPAGELGVIIGGGDHLLHGFTAGGRPLPGFPIACGAEVQASPLVADLDGNGRREIVAGAHNGIHLLRDVLPAGGAALQSQEWPMFRHDGQRRGRGGR